MCSFILFQVNEIIKIGYSWTPVDSFVSRRRQLLLLLLSQENFFPPCKTSLLVCV